MDAIIPSSIEVRTSKSTPTTNTSNENKAIEEGHDDSLDKATKHVEGEGGDECGPKAKPNGQEGGKLEHDASNLVEETPQEETDVKADRNNVILADPKKDEEALPTSEPSRITAPAKTTDNETVIESFGTKEEISGAGPLKVNAVVPDNPQNSLSPPSSGVDHVSAAPEKVTTDLVQSPGTSVEGTPKAIIGDDLPNCPDKPLVVTKDESPVIRQDDFVVLDPTSGAAKSEIDQDEPLMTIEEILDDGDDLVINKVNSPEVEKTELDSNEEEEGADDYGVVEEMEEDDGEQTAEEEGVLGDSSQGTTTLEDTKQEDIETIDINTDDDDVDEVEFGCFRNTGIDQLGGADEGRNDSVLELGRKHSATDEIGLDEEEDDEEMEIKFLEMKSTRRGMKRRICRNAHVAQVLKRRSIKWLNNSNITRMHVMDSVCRDAMIRPMPDAVEGSKVPRLSAEPLLDEKHANIELPENSPPTVTDIKPNGSGTINDKEDHSVGGANDNDKLFMETAIPNVPNGLVKANEETEVVCEAQEPPLVECQQEIVQNARVDEPIRTSIDEEDCDKENNSTNEDVDNVQAKDVSDVVNVEARMKNASAKDPEPCALNSGTETVKQTADIPQESSDNVVVVNDVPMNTKMATEVAGITTANSEKTLKRKRSNSSDEGTKSSEKEDPVHVQTVKRSKDKESPLAKLHRELESNYGRHEKILSEFIAETTENVNTDDIQKNVEELVIEIQTLNDMIKAKEMEWNNMVHLKKVKEEIMTRLTRKRQVQMITVNGPLESSNHCQQYHVSMDTDAIRPPVSEESEVTRPLALTNKMLQIAQTMTSGLANTTSKTTQSILQNRASMTSEDLEKEKNNTAKLHRHSNRTPPSNHQGSSSSTTPPVPMATTNTAITASTPMQQIHQTQSQQPQQTQQQTPLSTAAMMNTAMAAFQALQEQQQQQNFVDLLNGQHQIHQKQQQQQQQQLAKGRQGAIKDVKSIIDDYRQRHPETVPRRGRHHSQQTQNQTQQLQGSSNSLLHGILTKQQNQANRAMQNANGTPQASAANVSGFSPTLARLLTAPERISTTANSNYPASPVMNLSKSMKSEITITPVLSGSQSGSVNNASNRLKQEQMLNMLMQLQEQEDQDDNSVDRLVIDEAGQEFHENEVPECQGCKRREAQFVCAGCGNQWYCSRECQVSAWDEHSETCTG